MLNRNQKGVTANRDDIEQLKRIVKDLDAKSQEDENRVREMNVNIENLNMNVSLQHRTVLGLVEDRKSRSTCLFRFHYSHVLTFSFSLTDKELIDQHQKDIDELKNKAPVAMPEIKGDFDMGEMMKIFAAKTPPDNTIKRIEDLESMMTDLNGRLKNVNPTKAIEAPE